MAEEDETKKRPVQYNDDLRATASQQPEHSSASIILARRIERLCNRSTDNLQHVPSCNPFPTWQGMMCPSSA